MIGEHLGASSASVCGTDSRRTANPPPSGATTAAEPTSAGSPATPLLQLGHGGPTEELGIGGDEGQGDAMLRAPGEKLAARGTSPIGRPAGLDGGAVAQGAGGAPGQAGAAGGRGRCAFSRPSAARPDPEATPVAPSATTQPRPACSGVMPGPELVAVQGQAGLQAQRVAGAQAGGHARRRASTACPERFGGRSAGHRDLDPVLAGVAGAGGHAQACPARKRRPPGSGRTAAASGDHGASRARACGPWTAMMARPAVMSVAPEGRRAPGPCWRRWA